MENEPYVFPIEDRDFPLPQYKLIGVQYSKKSPTGPTEQTPKPENPNSSIAPFLGVRC